MGARINNEIWFRRLGVSEGQRTINQSDCDLPLPLGSNGARFAGEMAIFPHRGRNRFAESIIYDRAGQDITQFQTHFPLHVLHI